MPSDDYTSVGGGLKLKGAKVSKKKKKSKKADLERALSTGEARKDDETERTADGKEPAAAVKENKVAKGPSVRKTEAELRYEEVKRKRLLDLAEKANTRPELLKTHKERVEELNTYLSKLSEHHDMPKIGPG